MLKLLSLLTIALGLSTTPVMAAGSFLSPKKTLALSFEATKKDPYYVIGYETGLPDQSPVHVSIEVRFSYHFEFEDDGDIFFVPVEQGLTGRHRVQYGDQVWSGSQSLSLGQFVIHNEPTPTNGPADWGLFLYYGVFGQKNSTGFVLNLYHEGIFIEDTQQRVIGFNSGLGDVWQLTKATAVPEPSSWALLILGFGLIGSVARLRASMRVDLPLELSCR